MQMTDRIRERLAELFSSGTIDRAVGYAKGEFAYDCSPALFNNAKEAENAVYNSFSGANLSKYLVTNTIVESKTAVLLKPCDTYSMNQLFTEHRAEKDNLYLIGVTCSGMADIEKIKSKVAGVVVNIKENGGVLTVNTVNDSVKIDKADVLLDKCVYCKSKKHVCYDEIIGDSPETDARPADRFAEVEVIEKMSPDERFAFWKAELNKCIRCNACRNACPACTCRKCIFDNNRSGIASKANSTEFEEKLFHIIRAFHVAGRCTDCGECSRACPQGIPLHLLNRKFIKDINSLYGEYQAGETVGSRAPLVNYTENDKDPSDALR